MSNIHIKELDIKNKTVSCVFHIPVPAGNNSAGVVWTTAVKNSLNPIAEMSYNNQTENTAIENGEMLETAVTVRFSSISITDAQRLAEVEAKYETESVILLQKLANKLKFFGLEVN